MRSSLSFDEWVLAGTVDSKRSICKAVSVQNGGERQRQIVHLAPHEFREQPSFTYLVKSFPKFSRHGRGGVPTPRPGCVRYSSTAKSPPETCGTPRSWAGLTDGRLRCERRLGPLHDYTTHKRDWAVPPASGVGAHCTNGGGKPGPGNAEVNSSRHNMSNMMSLEDDIAVTTCSDLA
uniref:Uncharacterized protein n=1 Tax=Branchiostoma floridae TaxID=7739 RepID=C3ZMX4_BRAFL|eukprot:XP_002590103.1 hypothetical protein BRAFLDRAFT_83381 [Branchiostoma floridae]